MTYTEWRDELKSNLLCVSESERRRVLDYYAEAYADRREAGFSEREIIQEFGAPYDAAQRILCENKNNDYYVGDAQPEEEQPTRREKRYEERERRHEERERRREQQRYSPPPPPPPQAPPVYPNAYANNAPATTRGDYTWVFVLLCIIFAVPLFGLIMTMVGITIGFCVAPIAVIGSGAAAIAASIGGMVAGEVAGGVFGIGVGVMILGLGIVLCPLFFKLVGLMWKLFNQFFSWLKSLFSGRRNF